MRKTLAVLLVLAPVSAQAFTKCDLTDIGGPGAAIVEEASNPVVSGKWAYAGFAQSKKVAVLVASNGGATQQPVQIISAQPGPASNVRLAAAGKHVYVTWSQGERGSTHLWFAANGKNGQAGAWRAPMDLGPASHALQQISADGHNIHIAYMRLDNGDASVISSTDNGHTFKTPVDLGESDDEIVAASLGQDVYVAWEVGRTTAHPGVEYAVSHNNGVSFQTRNISDNGTRHAHEPIFSLNKKNGRLSLVWREDNPQVGTYLQSTDQGETWSTPLTIDGSSRQFMVQDDGDRVYVTYLKSYRIDRTDDWQVQIAISADGGHSFPQIQNLSGPSGISKIVGDNQRPVPWAGGGQVRVTGVLVDGARIWSGRGGQMNAGSVYLGPGEIAAPQGNVALWQEPEGVVTYAYCHQ